MGRSSLALPLLVIALLAAQVSPATPGSSSRVASVTDGDTLTLTDGRRVRLLQIDAPELGGSECYSRAARSALLALTPVGSQVMLEVDPALDRVDRYGRILRYLRRGPTNVNLELVRRGAAAPYFYRGEHGRYADELMRAATAARAAGRGLWGASRGTPLDPYRQVDTGRCGTTPAPLPVAGGRCDPNYAGACVPPYPPDLDCADLRALGLALPVRVIGEDPHRLDGDGDGYGCE